MKGKVARHNNGFEQDWMRASRILARQTFATILHEGIDENVTTSSKV